VEVDLHPEAEKRLSELGEEVFGSLERARPFPHGIEADGSWSHAPASTISAPLSWIEQTRDPFTKKHLRLEIHDKQHHLALSKTGLDLFTRLVDRTAAQRGISELASVEYIEERLTSWLQARTNGSAEKWPAAIRSAIAKDCREWRVVIPLEGVQLQSPFTIGHVQFAFFTMAYFDGALPPGPPDATEEDRKRMRRHFEKYLGVVYAAFVCSAVPERAQERAVEEVEFVLGLLRFFDPAAVDARGLCLLGRRSAYERHEDHFFLEREGIINESISRLRYSVSPKLLEPGELAFMMDLGLKRVDDLLRAPTRTPLEEQLLHSMVLFSSALVSPEIEHRLIYALVSVESLFLKNDHEAITSNLASRIARVARHALPDRRSVVSDLRAVYDVRSRFIHHGERRGLETLELVNRSIQYCWDAIRNLLENTRWTTKDEMLRALDDESLA